LGHWELDRVEVIELKGSPNSSVGSAVAQLFAEDSTLLEVPGLLLDSAAGAVHRLIVDLFLHFLTLK